MRSLAFAVTIAAVVLAAPAYAGPIPIVVVGDSLSDPYFHYQGANNPATGKPFWGRNHDKSWVEQVTTNYSANASFFNYAQAGAALTDLTGLASDKAAIRVQFFNVHRGVVIAGANDILAFINGQRGTDSVAFADAVASSLNTILTKLNTAGKVKLVVGNIPDLTLSPYLHELYGSTPGALQSFSQLIQATNAQISSVAHAQGAAVIDLFGLSHLADQPILPTAVSPPPLVLGGTVIPSDKFYAPDGYNPGSILQGLLSNAIMQAFGGDLGGIQQSDQDLLKLASLPENADFPGVSGPTYFDVSPYIQSTPEPASILLLGLAVCAVGARRYRLRAA